MTKFEKVIIDKMEANDVIGLSDILQKANNRKSITIGDVPLLIYAVSKNKHHIVAYLINEHFDVNIIDKNGYTSLMHSVMFTSRKVMTQIILDANPNVNKVAKLNGYTALMFATIWGNVDEACRILDMGANPNIQSTTDGRTALHVAVRNKYPKLIKKLISCGADTCVTDYDNTTPLSIAQCMKYTSALEVMEATV